MNKLKIWDIKILSLERKPPTGETWTQSKSSDELEDNGGINSECSIERHKT